MSMELWDLLDKDRRPLGQTHPRGRQYPIRTAPITLS